ncbi:MAG: outer membrane protein assembly factor BamD [Chromatiales bacterium]|jgi:outer membrane protein assembly factor BamD|nr:outer membrane protein assembly factor BamD [Chromatiales bacterium]
MFDKSVAMRLIAVTLLVALAGCSSKRGGVDPSDDAYKIYRKGEKSMQSGNYGTAIGQYEYLQAVYPFSEYAKQAQLDLMYAYYRSKEPDAAVEAADQFLLENPTHPRVDYAHYLKGLVYFERDRGPMEKLVRVDLSKRPPNRLEDSYRNFSIVATQYPDSIYAQDARQRMVYLRNRLAEYEIHVASYYVRRGAFVAASSRAKYVLENFQQTPSVVPALQIMVSAYRQMGLEELASDSMRVLEENYPDRAVAYGERGTEVDGTLLERLILRRNLKFWEKNKDEDQDAARP